MNEGGEKVMDGSCPASRWTVACALLGALGSVAVAPASAEAQERTLPLTIRDNRAAADYSGSLVDVLIRLDISGIDRFEIVRLVRRLADKSWQLAEITRAPAERLVIRAQPGLETLLLLRAASAPGYLLDGPFRWPAQPSTYVISPRWRRTVRGRQHRGDATSLTWVPGRDDGRRDGWPLCTWQDDESWECVGVPLSVPGVVVSALRGQVHYSVASGALTRPGIEEVTGSDAVWGRLLIVDTAQPGGIQRLAPVRASALRFSQPARQSDVDRLEATLDTDLHITKVGNGAFWLSGIAKPRDGWIELAGTGFAPLRLNSSELASAPPELPLRVALEPPVEIFGRVMAGPDLPAGGALVSLYRFAPDPASLNTPPRRVLVAEQHANDVGEFRFGDLSMEGYEVVAAHPGLGRGERRVDPDGQALEIDLHGARLERLRGVYDGARTGHRRLTASRRSSTRSVRAGARGQPW